VRPAREEEIEPLTRLFVRARNQWIICRPCAKKHVAVIADRIREHEELWLAEEDGRVVGFLGIEASRNLGGAAVLEKLYVEPGEQHRGIGAALLEKAKELRPEGLYLWCSRRTSTPAGSTSATASAS
jgi:GNAT superfamily N-acetyltransferase